MTETKTERQCYNGKTCILVATTQSQNYLIQRYAFLFEYSKYRFRNWSKKQRLSYSVELRTCSVNNKYPQTKCSTDMYYVHMKFSDDMFHRYRTRKILPINTTSVFTGQSSGDLCDDQVFNPICSTTGGQQCSLAGDSGWNSAVPALRSALSPALPPFNIATSQSDFELNCHQLN